MADAKRPSGGDDGAADPDEGAWCDRGGEQAGEKRRGGDAEVAGRFVEAEREAAAPGADEVDLHHDGHRPGEPLAGAEEQVCDDDEPPAGCDADQERHGQCEQPAEHEQALAAGAVGERARSEVRERLRQAEGDDEGEDRRLRGEVEVLLADQRQDGALEADHRADERVDPDEQGELAGVRAQTELDVAHAGRWVRPLRFAATISAWPSRRRRHVDEQRFYERILVLVLQRLIVTALESDRGEGVARQPAPADGAADMARIDDHPVIELQQLPHRRVELARKRLGIALRMQVGASDVPDEQ